MEPNDRKKVLEALLFVAEQPLTLRQLVQMFDQEADAAEIERLLLEMAQEWSDRGSPVEIKEIADGWQMATRPEFSSWVRKLFKDRLGYKLSQSAMETLTIIAYKQPITRNEIEEIRGVEVSAVLDTLFERKLVRIAGRKEAIGRPLLYATTAEFLRVFGLKHLEDLPAIDSLTPTTVLTEPEAPSEPASTASDFSLDSRN